MSTHTTQQPPATGVNNAKLHVIQALLAKASDPAATPQESETYVAKATELMAKHGIEQAVLDASKPVGEREKVVSRRIHVGGPYTVDRQNMLLWLAQAMHCKGLRYPGTDATEVFGFPSDLDRLELLYSSLLLQATRDMLKERVPYWQNTAAFRRSFLAAFSSVVCQRVKRLYQRTEAVADQSAPGTDLVLANRADQVKQAMAEVYPHLRKGGTRRLSGGGGDAGRASGRRADIGQPAAGGGRRGLPGR